MVAPEFNVPIAEVAKAAEQRLGCSVDALRIDDEIWISSKDEVPRIWEVLQVRETKKRLVIIIHEIGVIKK